MPFVDAKLSVADINSDHLDAAREAYKAEISCWRIIGPSVHPKTKQTSWLASRNSEVAIAEHEAAGGEGMAVLSGLGREPDIEAMEFTEKGYAMDFVMWRALGFAIRLYNDLDKPQIIL